MSMKQILIGIAVLALGGSFVAETTPQFVKVQGFLTDKSGPGQPGPADKPS